MSVLWVAMLGHGTNEPTTFGRGRHRDLAAKLVTFVGLALADAFNFGGMDAVNFVFIMMLLFKNPGADI